VFVAPPPGQGWTQSDSHERATRDGLPLSRRHGLLQLVQQPIDRIRVPSTGGVYSVAGHYDVATCIPERRGHLCVGVDAHNHRDYGTADEW